jgi:ABC-type transporter Mla maintaining outer membrane lipid asymmetry permease subunit MlaE
MRPIRLLATNRVRKLTPIIVALIFAGAARETSASSVGQKYMNPTPWIAQ